MFLEEGFDCNARRLDADAEKCAVRVVRIRTEHDRICF